jgi:hypothetical protein
MRLTAPAALLAVLFANIPLAAAEQRADGTYFGSPDQFAPDADCLTRLHFYPGPWHARRTARSWIFWKQPGKVRIVCHRLGQPAPHNDR